MVPMAGAGPSVLLISGRLANFAAMEQMEMTTDKDSCRILVSVMLKHGVREAVVSPGSRNAPLVVAVSACADIRTTVVVDERCAAFVALGKASVSAAPVMLVCTSGTAVLNYAPAVAEAYYRNIPLVVVSADRPMEWIDQDDSQTLRQYEALSHYVKRSYNIPSPCADDALRWYVNRVANDAMINCLSGRLAPVHINVQLDAPLGTLAAPRHDRWSERHISMVEPEMSLSPEQTAGLARLLAPGRKVLVIAGFHDPCPELDRALESLSESGHVAVMCETVANLRSGRFIHDIDATLSSMTEEELAAMRPDTVVTLGGAIVSRFVKAYLRGGAPVEHIHVGMTDNTVDCFQRLTVRVPMHPADFFGAMAGYVRSAGGADPCAGGYGERWQDYALRGRRVHAGYVESAPWSDLKAMGFVMSHLPGGCALQLSNGTSVRYAQLFPAMQAVRSDCNRGVSGIDGCTSTAIGASTEYSGPTVFVTGDMSAQYDMGAFALDCVPARFRMIVLCNGGGGIFRFIGSTSALPQLEEYFVVPRRFPLRQLAEAYGYGYFEAGSEDDLAVQFDRFMAPADRPAVLAIHTSGDVSASVLREYFRLKG